MGFNIGVYSKQETNHFDCYNFIERTFFNFVCSIENYGEESILVKSGNYYGLNLKPLSKFVYTWDAPEDDYINDNIQKTDFLLELVLNFKNKIILDNTVCEKIEYVWYDKPYLFDEQEIENFKNELGEQATDIFLRENNEMKNQIAENKNPWNFYFKELQILTDLDALIKSLQCYKDKGINEVYLTAG